MAVLGFNKKFKITITKTVVYRMEYEVSARTKNEALNMADLDIETDENDPCAEGWEGIDEDSTQIEVTEIEEIRYVP